MGRKARLRKQVEVEQERAEKLAIENRRRSMREPVLRWTKRIIILVLITVGLLYLGYVINERIAQLTNYQEEQS